MPNSKDEECELKILHDVLSQDLDHAKKDLNLAIIGHPMEQYLAGLISGLERALSHTKTLLRWNESAGVFLNNEQERSKNDLPPISDSIHKTIHSIHKEHTMKRHIHESNLIEGFDNFQFDSTSLGTWDFLKSHAHEYLNERMICIAHKALTILQTELNPNQTGCYRKINVTVGGRLCPPPHIVPELMHNWLLDMKEHWQDLEPKAMHIRFEKIHPFIDGNGRLGRLLMWWHEEKREREPTLILNSEKHKYYEWFRIRKLDI